MCFKLKFRSATATILACLISLPVMLSITANHGYDCNMWRTMAVTRWSADLWWFQLNAAPQTCWPTWFVWLQDGGQKAWDGERWFGGRSSSCVCWKEEDCVEWLPSTLSKNPDQKNKKPPHKHRVEERSHTMQFNKAEGRSRWGLRGHLRRRTKIEPNLRHARSTGLLGRQARCPVLQIKLTYLVDLWGNGLQNNA